MEAGDIERLFLRVLEDPGQDNHATRRIFSALVRSTLEYRDRILDSRDIIVTVDDVRASLEWLIPALVDGRMPESENEIRIGLLKAWLLELG